MSRRLIQVRSLDEFLENSSALEELGFEETQFRNPNSQWGLKFLGYWRKSVFECRRSQVIIDLELI